MTTREQSIAERLKAKLVRLMADADQVAFHHDQEGRKAASALLMAGKSLAFEEIMAWLIEQDPESVSRGWLQEEIDQEERSAVSVYARLRNQACDSEKRSR